MYTIKLNQHQAYIMREALECYSRLKSGQLDIVLNDCFRDRMSGNQDKVRLACDLIKLIILPELHTGASLGVGNREYPEQSVAWDMMQVVRYRLAWDRLKDQGSDEPEHYGVQYQEPMQYGTEPLMEIDSE